jgi:SNF family Na+-dependent transporter
MLNSRDARRRWFGAFFLIVAVGMLVWGLTILQTHLKGRAFVIYWLTCFSLTGLAVLTALIDVVVMGRRTRRQERDLFQKMFSEGP